jgi:hypothetical protein
VLAGVLFALVPLVGTHSSLMSDEGLVVIQARHLARTGDWALPATAPDVDPAGRWFPLSADRLGDGWASYAKHPAYPWLLSKIDRLGGYSTFIMLSVLAALGAAVGGALLARSIDPAADKTVLWTLGIGSPLLFDAYLVIAHTLAAAGAAGIALITISASRRKRLGWQRAAACVALCAAVTLLRSEAIVFGIAIAVAVGAAGALWRSRSLVAVAAAAIAGVVSGRLAEATWLAAISRDSGGGVLNTYVPDVARDFIRDRVAGAATILVRPSAGVGAAEVGLSTISSVALFIIGVHVLRRSTDRSMVRALIAIAAVATVVRLAVAPRLVPGILVAVPWLALAVPLGIRVRSRPRDEQLLWLSVALFVSGVIASQYAAGGAVEWGGRYLALTLPVLAPLVIVLLRNELVGMASPRLRTEIAVGVVVITALMSATSIVALRSRHADSERLDAAVAAGPPHAIVVATEPWMAPQLWPTFRLRAWLLASPAELAELGRTLAAASVTTVVIVSRDPDGDIGRLDAIYRARRVVKPRNGLGITLVEATRRAS